MKIVGISGLARSGKDLFATVAQNILEQEYNFTTDRHALAFELKSDLDNLISLKTGIDVFTDDTKKKNIIRPLLVAYGDMMRKVSDGRYWTNKMDKKISESKADVFFVTDVRYDFYPYDECWWVQNKSLGKLVHITRYKIGPAPSKRRVTTSTPVKMYDSAPNDHERLNDPKVKKKADYSFEWEDMSEVHTTHQSLLESSYIKDHVRKALESINVI